jgi:hypothetical protein
MEQTVQLNFSAGYAGQLKVELHELERIKIL